jgi:LysR family hydrogen peroxide-inducible transcriptional activator
MTAGPAFVKSPVENSAICFSYGSAMEIRHLEVLAAVVEAGSLTAAAARCHLSQPAISQQIHALEEEIGEALLFRRPRGVEPTAAGRTVLEHAVRLLAERDKLRDVFAGRRRLQHGRVAFGIIPTIAPYLLPQWLGPFRERFPGIAIAISESRTEDLIKQLVDGGIEFAVLSDVPEADRQKWSLQIRELFREPLLLAAPANHPLALRKAPPTPADLKADELIHLKGGHCLSDRTLRLCKIREPDPGLQCDQLGTALSMVASGLGVTVVPQLATRHRAMDGVVLRPFAGKGLHRVIALLKRRGSKDTPAAAELLKTLAP